MWIMQLIFWEPTGWYHPTTSMSTKATTDLLEQDFAHFGYPHTIISDNATSFSSEEFQAWCRERGIIHLTSAPITRLQMEQQSVSCRLSNKLLLSPHSHLRLHFKSFSCSTVGPLWQWDIPRARASYKEQNSHSPPFTCTYLSREASQGSHKITGRGNPSGWKHSGTRTLDGCQLLSLKYLGPAV